MNKNEQKEVTNRVIKELLKEETNPEILETLSKLSTKVLATNQADFETMDISNIAQKECSQEEVKLLRVCIIKAIKKELKRKYSLLVTTRLVIALWELDAIIEEKKMKKRAMTCYRYVENFESIFGQEKEVLEIIRDLADS